MRRRVSSVVVALAALGSCGSPPSEHTRDETIRAQVCDGGATTWGVPAYDALYALASEDGRAWVFTENPREGVDVDHARALVDAALQQDPATLQIRPRLILQHDVWGLHERLTSGVSSELALDELARQVAALERRLALPADEIPMAAAMPDEVRVRLPAELGWREVASEMPVLSHESAFGLRRIFRVALRSDGDEVALFSQLVVRDDAGRARQTALTGELEVLTMKDAEVVGARVFELNRRAVGCGAGDVLVPVDVVETVPVHAADRYFGRFDRPMRVDELPCLQCHHDPHMGSLPTEALAPSWRWQALLDQTSAPLPSAAAAG